MALEHTENRAVKDFANDWRIIERCIKPSSPADVKRAPYRLKKTQRFYDNLHA